MQTASTMLHADGSGKPAGLSSHAMPGSAEEVLEQGHPWLRFPKALEAQFQANLLEPRRKLLLTCGWIGIFSVALVSAQVAQLMPDVAELALQLTKAILVACAVCQTITWSTPPRWRRHWHAEALTTLMTVSIGAALINACVISRADSTFTHSAALVSIVMYTCIVARQRFYWSLGSSILSFVAYAALVEGYTPLQHLIVAANIKLMALSYVFVLVANYAFEHRERRNWLLRKLEAQQRGALKETSERLHRLSAQDPLTGLINRRQFDTDLALAWSQAVFAKEPVAMLMVDVDFFKRYNDTYGHPAGDACLIQVAKELNEVAQAHGGIAARLGGEEFGLLLPGRTLDEAMAVAAALCEGVRAAHIEHKASTVSGHVTVSVGAALAWPAQGGG
ncbi:diguanylate cyclase, partial [Aquabacterium sp.]|uniref:GGDEF domain-containing protein n=1 Tax=Aquabacterium sp. TaxID=1872578 RepID=UPI0019AE5779